MYSRERPTAMLLCSCMAVFYCPLSELVELTWPVVDVKSLSLRIPPRRAEADYL